MVHIWLIYTSSAGFQGLIFVSILGCMRQLRLLLLNPESADRIASLILSWMGVGVSV